MKIRYRILLINFIIVVLIISASAIAFYSIMYTSLTSQRSQYLSRSVNDFNYSYRELLQGTDDDFHFYLKNSINNISDKNLQHIDFIFRETGKGSLLKEFIREEVYLSSNSFSLEEFINENPHSVIKKYVSNDVVYYYGRIISEELLNMLSKKIDAEIAVVLDNSPFVLSNEAINRNSTFNLTEAYKDLKVKNNFDHYAESTDNSDLIAILVRNSTPSEINNDLEFLVFNTIDDAADLRANLKTMLAIIGTAGVFLSLILTFIFTDKIRKQLTQLSKATEITKDGNFKNRIVIKSKDEIGELTNAFNNMLDTLEKNHKSKQEYSEFITLINQNPSLKEVSEAALRKIIKTCNFSVGALYLVENKSLTLLSSYGLKDENTNAKAEL
ncbi:MAG: HAMP domain-containing protein, partial [Ignavibacteriales bacterium]